MGLVSIVTPTFPGREELLKDRCMASVLRQNWPGELEHVVVSDRNPRLATALNYVIGDRVRQIQINESWRNPITEASIGAIPWYVGSLLALGEFVGFLGDDDEYLPDHVSRHIEHLERTGGDFSISQVEFRVDNVPQFIVGDDTFALGHLDATGIFCRAPALAVANWTATGENAADHRLVQDWLRGGLKGVVVPGGPTAIHHDGWAAGRTGRPDRPS